MIKMTARGFIAGYVIAIWINIAVGGVGFRPLLDLVVGILYGWIMYEGLLKESRHGREENAEKNFDT